MVSMLIGDILLPVLPEVLEVRQIGVNASYTLQNLGEITLLKTPKQRTYHIASFFPDKEDPFADGAFAPKVYVEQIAGFFNEKKPVEFIVKGNAVPLKVSVTIENFTYREQAGDVGTVYFELDLKEYRVFSAVKNDFSKTDTVVSRVDVREPVKTYTVKSGDSLWAIAKLFLGDGSRYPELVEINKIKNPKLIYPGQVVKLPV